ncbi:hypothetical protein DFR52_101325 [Hoeflea marina]|uniref:Uncharacterized protein n=1 Tax=Hoeflea marina TaxID=274592 RepID=A0A317PW19_9HYPH|nr:hypothetical protein [Hoeflea marina]PWW03640.1 hypothetical protein DFR52_101325 [Hoeflea marina]
MVLAVSLGACASRTPPRASAVVSLTSVSVTALDPDDRVFADRLDERLRATAGRPSRDVGQAATLAVTVIERGRPAAAVFLPGVGRDFARWSVSVTEDATGRVLYSGVWQSAVSGTDAADSDAGLAARIAGDVRILLGLGATVPSPIEGPKRAVARPSVRPLPSEAALDAAGVEAADPLLNGTVTPTSVPAVAMDEDVPVLDTSRPLLAAESDAQAATSVAPIADGVPAGEVPVRAAAPSDASSDPDEPCIVTIETDCQSPVVN